MKTGKSLRLVKLKMQFYRVPTLVGTVDQLHQLNYMDKKMKFLYTIRSLPEATRRLLAICALAVAAFVLFNGWRLALSSRLTAISDTPGIVAVEHQGNGADEEDINAPVTQPLSPLAGVEESLKGLEGFFSFSRATESKHSFASFSPRYAAGLIASSFTRISSETQKGLKNAFYFLYEKSQREVTP